MARKVDIPLPQPFPDKPSVHSVSQMENETGGVTPHIDWPNAILLQVEISHFIQSARSTNTPFLDIQKLLVLDFSHLAPHAVELAEMQRNLYHHSLFAHGVNALAHLCLPFSYHSELTAQGVEQLSQLRSLIESNNLKQVPGLGKKGAECVALAFRHWAIQPLIILNPNERL